MTCKDCIHLQQNTCEHYNIEVDADAYRICAEMVSKDGTFHDNTEHCPKCGKPVSEWGLCDDCRKMYEDMRCINDEECKAWDLLMAKNSICIITDECNSWESISK